MTNLEYYKDELIKIDRVAIINNKPKRCNPKECSICLRHCKRTCTDTDLINWLAEEHREYPVLTRLQYEILTQLYNNDYKYLVRDDKFNTLEIHINKPYKDHLFWMSDRAFLKIDKPLDTFDFVKWEDSEPWSIKELLLNNE